MEKACYCGCTEEALLRGDDGYRPVIISVLRWCSHVT